MRGTAASLTVKNAFKNFHPKSGTWGIVNTLTPKEQGRKDGEKTNAAEEISEPVVAFSKPPPLPPVLGPVVAFSLFETWHSSDDNDE